MWRKCLLFLLLINCEVFCKLFDLTANKEVHSIKNYVFWPNATIPFYVNPDHFDHEQSLAILTCLAMFAFRTCLKFAPVMTAPSTDEHVLVFNNPGGKRRCSFAFSRAHTMYEPHIVTIGYDCIKSPNIEMVVMKALGFPFEHNRVNRDIYIDIMTENIDPGAIELFTRESFQPLEMKGIQYDVNSVTHFGIREYSKNGHRTIIFKDPHIRQNRKSLTKSDLRKIEVVYGSECRNRDRQEKIELCQSYPGVARRKRNAETIDKGPPNVNEKADTNNAEDPKITKDPKADLNIATKSLRVNPAITPPVPTEESDSINELGIESEIQTIVDQIHTVASKALENVKEKFCANTTQTNVSIKVDKIDNPGNYSQITDIVNAVTVYTQHTVNRALADLSKFCQNGVNLDSYQRSGCSWNSPDPRCNRVYRSTKNGPVMYSTKHRPWIRQSTKHDVFKRHSYARNGAEMLESNAKDTEKAIAIKSIIEKEKSKYIRDLAAKKISNDAITEPMSTAASEKPIIRRKRHLNRQDDDKSLENKTPQNAALDMPKDDSLQNDSNESSKKDSEDITIKNKDDNTLGMRSTSPREDRKLFFIGSVNQSPNFKGRNVWKPVVGATFLPKKGDNDFESSISGEDKNQMDFPKKDNLNKIKKGSKSKYMPPEKDDFAAEDRDSLSKDVTPFIRDYNVKKSDVTPFKRVPADDITPLKKKFSPKLKNLFDSYVRDESIDTEKSDIKTATLNFKEKQKHNSEDSKIKKFGTLKDSIEIKKYKDDDHRGMLNSKEMISPKRISLKPHKKEIGDKVTNSLSRVEKFNRDAKGDNEKTGGLFMSVESVAPGVYNKNKNRGGKEKRDVEQDWSEQSDSDEHSSINKVPKTLTLTKENREFYDERVWPKGVVRYILGGNIDYDKSDVRARLAEVNDILKKKTCVRIQEVTESEAAKHTDYLVIDNSPDYVTGRVGRRQNFGSVELLRGGQHRQHAAMMVMAMLGFYFEVSRHDRDKYIRVHLRHIRPDKIHHFEKIRADATLAVPYDYESALHPAWQFWRQIGRTGISTVATFKENDPDGALMKKLGQHEKIFSDTDILKINSVYGVDCFTGKDRKKKGHKSD